MIEVSKRGKRFVARETLLLFSIIVLVGVCALLIYLSNAYVGQRIINLRNAKENTHDRIIGYVINDNSRNLYAHTVYEYMKDKSVKMPPRFEGFVQNLASDSTKTLKLFDYLQQKGFVDDTTSFEFFQKTLSIASVQDGILKREKGKNELVQEEEVLSREIDKYAGWRFDILDSLFWVAIGLLIIAYGIRPVFWLLRWCIRVLREP